LDAPPDRSTQSPLPDLRISRSAMYEWNESSRGERRGRAVDRRGGDRRSTSDDAAWAEFPLALSRTLQTAIQAPLLEDGSPMPPGENGWPVVCAQKLALPKSTRRIPPSNNSSTVNPSAWRQQLRPYILKIPNRGALANAGWAIISSLICGADLVRRFVRPWLTSFIDWRTAPACGLGAQ